MAGYGRIFSIAGASTNCRNLLTNRNVVNNAQPYSSLKAKALVKLGIPPKPKRPLTPFFKFMKDDRVRVVEENPNLNSREVLKKVAQNWSSYDVKEKEILQKAYDMELLTYSKQIMIYEQSITPEQKKTMKEAQELQHDKNEKLKCKKKMESLGKPKKPATSFIQFLQERKYTKSKDEKVTDWIKSLAEAWRSLSLEEKTKYQLEGQKLMEQYRHDIREWEEKMVRLGNMDVVRNRGLIDLKSPKAV